MISAILRAMTGDAPSDVPRFAPEAFRARVDLELGRSIDATRALLAERDPGATFLADELERLIGAGGSRLRPICCVAGFRAGGGRDGEPIVRAAAALEFLHLMAVIHDDVMDDAKDRRGVSASHRHLAELARDRAGPMAGDADNTGRSLAILAGDLAGVCADLLFAESGFPADRLAAALERYHAIRLDMAAGQALDVLGTGEASRVAALKGGSYSIVGPLLVGAALAGATADVERVLVAFGEPLGTAFQLRDDLRDGDAGPGVDEALVSDLIERARGALDRAPFDTTDLRAIAEAVAQK
jgi:geranylgeranyl diphosphate synthase type I